MKRVIIVALVLMALGSAMLFAAGTQEAAKQEPAAQLTGKLTIWSTLTQKERAVEFENLARAYEKDRPGVTVEITLMPWSGAMDKIMASIMAGNPPDIMVTGNGYPQTLSATGGLMELSSVVDQVGGKDAFLGTSLSVLGSAEDGGMYSVPLYVTPYVAYYRKSWLADAGITKLPTTWEEYYEMCKAVTDPANNRYGFGLPLGDLHGWKTVWSILQTQGVDLVKQNAKGDWIVDVSDEDYKAIVWTYDYLYKLVRDCSPAGIVSYTQANVRELVATGAIMSRIDTPEIYYNVKAMAPEAMDDVAFFEMPKAKQGGGGTGWVGLSIAEKGNKALASDYIKYIYTGERMVDFFASYPYAMFPAKAELFNSKSYQDKLPAELKGMVPEMALSILKDATGLTMANGPFPGAGEVESKSLLGNPLANMLIKGINANQAADQLIADLKALL
ncbi:MAG: extracellular solute-binding protein [Spirochaetia bacterium]|uniref:ABC transporter substrate-binding protein n=1 Tax=Sphaerochaeta sp. TaxID=1972642 RepID=UPI002A2F62D6|nr:extracellular solute-binding protein [Sphaerochaeta sp.]NBK22646.1 extracellular solute-binding protein [Spirochaetia bacterium]